MKTIREVFSVAKVEAIGVSAADRVKSCKSDVHKGMIRDCW